MGDLVRAALRVAVAVLVVLPLQATTAAAPPRLLAPAATFRLDALPPVARDDVIADVASTNAAARSAIDLVDGSIAIDLDVKRCPPLSDSCSYGEPDGATTPWRIHLGADTSGTTAPTPRFIVLHEIGHAVYGLVFDPSDRAAFEDAVRRSLHGAPCHRVRQPDKKVRPCAPIWEVFADEFARFAGGYADNLTGYDTPSLLAASTMARLVTGAVAKSEGRPGPLTGNGRLV
jgi:hypothetical protein